MECRYFDSDRCTYYNDKEIKNKEGSSVIMNATMYCSEVTCPIRHPDILKGFVVLEKE